MDELITIEPREAKEPTSRVKIGYAAWVNNPVGSMELFGDSILPSLTGENEPDKMAIPEDFQDRVKLSRYFYERDPIANTVIDKIIEIGIGPLILDRNQCSDEEYAVYEHMIPVFQKYLKEAALEYLLSGLVLPRVFWESVPPTEINGLENKSKRYNLPVESWVLDPANITLVQIPLLNDVVILMDIPNELRTYVSSGGKVRNLLYKDGIAKIEEIYPEIFEALRNEPIRYQVILKDQFMVRRRSKTYDPYPTPFLLPALESLMFKRNLKKMDYSIASRVISAIQVIRLGNDEYPLTEDDEDQLSDLELKMLWRNRAKNIDRVFQLFSNHTLDIEWVYPDTEAMLNQEKYDAVNQDIFYAIGFPRILVNGETMRSATSQAEFAMFAPAETIRRFREELLIWITELVKQIQERNKFDNRAKVRFEELRLYDLAKLTDLVSTLYQNNALSLTSLSKALGFDFRDEVEMKAQERELMKEFDIPEFPAMPFSPKPGGVGDQPQEGDQDAT